jgi:hypothetical protein
LLSINRLHARLLFSTEGSARLYNPSAVDDWIDSLVQIPADFL